MLELGLSIKCDIDGLLLRDVLIQAKQELFVFSVRRGLMKKPPVCLHDLIRTAVFVIKLFERLDAYLIKGTSRKLNDMEPINDDLGLGENLMNNRLISFNYLLVYPRSISHALPATPPLVLKYRVLPSNGDFLFEVA